MLRKEYIEREALGIGKCNPEVFEDKGYAMGWNAAIDVIQNAPAADVRPVVLCKDCVHYEMAVCLKIYDDGAANKDAWQERKPDDFCSYGEKREES